MAITRCEVDYASYNVKCMDCGNIMTSEINSLRYWRCEKCDLLTIELPNERLVTYAKL